MVNNTEKSNISSDKESCLSGTGRSLYMIALCNIKDMLADAVIFWEWGHRRIGVLES
jgi:hypothetical protein